MKRRDFTKSLAALFAAPVVPAKAIFAAPSIAPVAPAAILPPNLYTYSAMIARTKGTLTPAALMKALKIDAAQATRMINRLIANNVVTPANALGHFTSKPIAGRGGSVRRLSDQVTERLSATDVEPQPSDTTLHETPDEDGTDNNPTAS